MTGLRGAPYAMNQASYDLARLRGNGLIERIGRTNAYRLTADGLTFALVYTGSMIGSLPAHRARPADRRPSPSPGSLADHHPTYRQNRRRHPPRARGLNPSPRSWHPPQTRGNRRSPRASER